MVARSNYAEKGRAGTGERIIEENQIGRGEGESFSERKNPTASIARVNLYGGTSRNKYKALAEMGSETVDPLAAPLPGSTTWFSGPHAGQRLPRGFRAGLCPIIQ